MSIHRAVERHGAAAPRGLGRAAVALLAASGVALGAGPSGAVNLSAPPSLKTIPVPEPSNLGSFLRSVPGSQNADGFPVPTAAARESAIRLGKALFWDMQVGSDNALACASCHFHAGADNRTKNQVSPGLNAGDTMFDVIGPNGTLTGDMFPFHTFLDPDDRFSPVLSDANDVVSSQGVRLTSFVGLSTVGTELGARAPDPVFSVGGLNVRRVEARNAPTVINAVFNFANFWDGRANNVFNGVSPFGDADPDAGVYVRTGNTVQKQRVRLPMSSLASQAVGPPGSNFEMSFMGRAFPHIGRKLLKVVPLGLQEVHPNDSVLGPLAKSTIQAGQVVLKPGLATTYAALIQAAFADRYWASPSPVGTSLGSFTQMEANFSLFFGLAVQMYEATLVSDDSPFDRFQEGDDAAMSQSAQAGLAIFITDVEQDVSGGSCINCHGGSELTNASAGHVGATNFGASFPEELLELMTMGDGGSATYDAGYYDIGVRPIEDDVGRGGTDPFGFPLSFTDRALVLDGGGALPFATPPLPCGLPGTPPVCPAFQRSATAGSFKAPTLRNVELTGPYFHNGGQATLRQVVDFYTRGGDFHESNQSTLDPDIERNFGLAGNEAAKKALVDFLLALTDERVRWETAPFDHPSLSVPHGATGDEVRLASCGKDSCNEMLKIPAVGADGLAAEGRPPIGTFLDLDPHQP